MPCDALTYSFAVNELNEVLKDGKIEKITMPKHDEVLLFVRKNRVTRILNICVGANSRIHISAVSKPAPISAFSFCMNLRKNILGGIIESVEKQPDERVIIFNIRFLNELNLREDKKLICEIMGKYSNVILTNTDFKIFECVKHIPIDSSINRPLLAGLTYSLPVQDKLSPLDSEGICALPPVSVGQLRSQIKGLAPISFDEAVYLAGVSGEQVDLEEKSRVAVALRNMHLGAGQPCVHLDKLDGLDENHLDGLDENQLDKNGVADEFLVRPCVHLDENGVADEFFMRPYRHISQNYMYFDTLNEAMDYYYCVKESAQKLNDRAKSLAGIVRNALKKCVKRVNELSQNYQASLNYVDDKLKGDLITANIYRIKQGDKVLVAENFYDNNQRIEIALDSTRSPSQNAQKYFKSYAKKKRAIGYIEEMLAKCKSETEDFEELLEEIGSAREIGELEDIAELMLRLNLIKSHTREKNSPLSEPHRFEVDGFEVIAGKNSVQNERITKGASGQDIWMHVKDFRGSHVILRTLGRAVSDEVIAKVASIAGYFSKASGADKVEVDYTYAKHVSKPSGSSMGRVVYRNHSTVLVKPKLP